MTRVFQDRGAAAEAWKLAQEQGVNEAARRLAVGTGSLYRAWDRWDLGVPDTSASAARWERQLHKGRRRPATHRPNRSTITPGPPHPGVGLAGQRGSPRNHHAILRILRRAADADPRQMSNVRVA